MPEISRKIENVEEQVLHTPSSEKTSATDSENSLKENMDELDRLIEELRCEVPPPPDENGKILGFKIEGANLGDNMGFSIPRDKISFSNPGDINDDRLEDLLIGAPKGSVAGKSYVIFGNEKIKWNWDDINKDGIEDLIMGSPKGSAGNAHVIFGEKPDENVLLIDDNQWEDEEDFENEDLDEIDTEVSGKISISNPGDVNHDGFPDLLIGPPKGSPGEAYVVFGNEKNIWKWKDLNNDGFEDLVLGGYIGKIHVMYGGAEGIISSMDLKDMIDSNEDIPGNENTNSDAPKTSAAAKIEPLGSQVIASQLMLGAVALKMAQNSIDWLRSFWTKEKPKEVVVKPVGPISAREKINRLSEILSRSKTMATHLPRAEQQGFNLALSEHQDALRSAKSASAISHATLKDLSADIRSLALEILESYNEGTSSGVQSPAVFTGNNDLTNVENQAPAISFAYTALAANTNQGINTIEEPHFNRSLCM